MKQQDKAGISAGSIAMKFTGVHLGRYCSEEPPGIAAHKPQQPIEDPDPEPANPVPVEEPDTPKSGPPPGKPKS